MPKKNAIPAAHLCSFPELLSTVDIVNANNVIEDQSKIAVGQKVTSKQIKLHYTHITHSLTLTSSTVLDNATLNSLQGWPD